MIKQKTKLLVRWFQGTGISPFESTEKSVWRGISFEIKALRTKFDLCKLFVIPLSKTLVSGLVVNLWQNFDLLHGNMNKQRSDMQWKQNAPLNIRPKLWSRCRDVTFVLVERAIIERHEVINNISPDWIHYGNVEDGKLVLVDFLLKRK